MLVATDFTKEFSLLDVLMTSSTAEKNKRSKTTPASISWAVDYIVELEKHRKSVRCDEFPDIPNAVEANRQRARQLASTEIEYRYSPVFSRKRDVQELLEETRNSLWPQDRSKIPKAPAGMPPYLASLYEVPLLTKEREYRLFAAMNYLKYTADRLRRKIDVDRPNTDLLDTTEALVCLGLALRNYIVRANLRLVVSIAKKLVDQANRMEDLISDGNMPLIRAVEIFDFERGTRFSTYATWAVRNSLYRSSPKSHRLRKRFSTGADAVFAARFDEKDSELSEEIYFQDIRTAVAEMISHLDGRDKRIVKLRFGINEEGRPQKFREIAENLGISTERVRQLLARALHQLSDTEAAEGIELS